MEDLKIIAFLVITGSISLFLSRRWLKRNHKPSGLDFATGFSKARAMALLFIGACCLVLAIIMAVKLM